MMLPKLHQIEKHNVSINFQGTYHDAKGEPFNDQCSHHRETSQLICRGFAITKGLRKAINK